MKNENKFKSLYQLSKMRKVLGYNSMDFKHLQQPPLLQQFNNDSLEIIPTKQLINHPQHFNQKSKKQFKISHNRSQSCPYTFPLLQQRPVQLRQTNRNFYQGYDNSIVEQRIPEQSQTSSKMIQIKKINRLNKNLLPFSKKSSGMRKSGQLSQSNKSVVIHNHHALNSFQLSSMLYSEKKSLNNQDMKKKCLTKVSKRNLQNGLEDEDTIKQKYLKIKIDQQIKKYQLRQDLKKLEKESSDINIKQNVLQNILKKNQSENHYLGYQTNQSYIFQQQI